ncbi:MAG: alcohol dehydrogenase catalytic domain-containing protein [Prevotella sp.]|nr:alcohol dehydrogenase catalytic domain-containing protein [Prevotella sp.]
MNKLNVKRVIIDAPFHSKIEDTLFDIPVDHSLIVKVCMCGICTAEQRVFKGTSNKKYPYWGGHELFGTVEKVISDSSKFKEGDIVALSLMHRCGTCYYCQHGLDNHCAYVHPANELPNVPVGPNGFCNYITVLESNVFFLPTQILDKRYIFIEPTACVFRSIEIGKPKECVGIIGEGTFGILHALILHKLGHRVFIFGEGNGNLFKQLPIDGYFDLESISDISAHNEHITTFFCTQYGEKGLNSAINLVERGGNIVLFQSVPDNNYVTVDFNRIHYKEISIKGSIAHTKQNFIDAMNFMSENIDMYDYLSIKLYDITEHALAFKTSISHKYNRIAITFQ